MYVLGIGDLIKEGIAGVLLLLDTIIYGLISGAYKIFMALASARILSSDAYSNIANSLYAVIGVVMLFVLAYAVIRMIMDPDQTTKGELSGGNLVKGIAIAVIGLAITPTIFEYLYQAQGLFVEHDVIGKIFFRNFDNNEIDLGAAGITTTDADECQNQSNNTAKTNCYVKSVGGAVAATSIWTAFFYPSNPCDENGQPDGCKGADDITIKAEDLYVKGGQLIAIGAGVGIALGVAAAVGWIPVAGWVIGGLLAAGALIYAGVQTVKQGDKVKEMTGGEEISLADAYAATSSGESFIIYTGFLSKYQSDGDISYLMGVSTLCGIFALYAFVSFSIDMGVRAAKLAYYQIIAPIPLVLQIIPKFKKNFTQYVSSLFQTFIEVFIRISVVYIVVYIICHLTELFSSADRLWENNALNTPERYLALALLIMGLIIFAKDAPKIITESLGIQGGMGDFKSLREKLAKGGFFSAASIVGSGAKGLARGALDDRGDAGKPWWKRAGNRIRNAGSGMLESMGRNAWSQFGAPGHKHADSFRAARDAAASAVDAADVARGRRMENKDDLHDARQHRQKIEDQKARLQAVREKLANNQALDDDEQKLLEGLDLKDKPIEDIDKKLEDLEQEVKVQTKRITKYTIKGKIGSKVEDLREQLTPVSDPKKEKEKMDYATRLKKFNGELRDMAYEEEGTFASQKYREYQQEQQKKISRYQDGWDDDSIREEASARRARLNNADSSQMREFLRSGMRSLNGRMSDPNVSAEDRAKMQRLHDSYQDQINELDRIDNNIGVTDSAISGLQSRIASASDAEKPALQQQLQSLQNAREEMLTSRETIRTKIKSEIQQQLDFEYKLTDAEYADAQQKHSELVKSLKDQAEAAADAWIYETSLDPENMKVADKISTFVAENIAYVRANGDQILKTDSGSMSIRETLERLAGGAAYNAGEYSVTAANSDTSYVSQNAFEYGPPDASGKKKQTYFRKGYVKNDRGEIVLSDKFMFFDTPAAPASKPSEPEEVRFHSEAEFFGQQGASGIKALTPASKMGKYGNDSARYTNIHEYTPKQQRAMQRREKQEGKK